jgi:hypothetical protein
VPCLPSGTAWRREDHVGRSPYQSEKRRKELARLKKQEEKRQRRFNKKHEGEKGPDQPGEPLPEGSAPAGQLEGITPDSQDAPGEQPPRGSEETGQSS